MKIKCLIPLLVLSVSLFDSVFGQKITTDVKTQHSSGFHYQLLVVDAHAHNLTFDDLSKENQLHADYLKKGGVDVLGLDFAYYPLKGLTLTEKVQTDFSRLKNELTHQSNDIKIASDSKSLMTLVNDGKVALFPGVEFFYGIFNNEVSVVDSLYDIGIRTITIMDNNYDPLSKKTSGKETGQQLSDFGKQVIRRMNRLEMLIDISHQNDGMQRAVIDYSSAPVIASHSPARGAYNSERNIPDLILRQLAKKQGAIMITFNSGDLAGLEEGRTTIDKLIDHIVHAVEIMGIDYVGIGSDFNGAGRRSPSGLENAACFPNLTKNLLERGFTRAEIKKIMGTNYINLLKRVESVSDE
ncbi:MAG: dipeptidase [Bacteroidales bacterium]|nr:dipeptidase [Bacteroidales bacterium]MCF8334557.1 dipeptidase [Bacteroidales bacterium]